MSRIKNFIVLAMLIVPAVAFANAQQAPVEIHFQWSLSLAADGQITNLAPISKAYKPIVREQLEPIVRGWHFTPGKVDGRPAAAETTLTMHAALEPAGGETYRVGVTSAVTGAGYESGAPPKYPLSALRMERYGLVWLQVNHDASGHVVSAAPVVHAGEPRVDRALTKAAIDTVKQWTFRPERVAGHGVAGSVLEPFCFSTEELRDPCHWAPARGEIEVVDSTRPIPLASVVTLDMASVGHMP
jgi:TonB family protein